MTKENKDITERGKKARAGQLLSEYIRGIGQEITEVVLDDSPVQVDGTPNMPRIISKAEALARYVWDRALPRRGETGDFIPPDLDYIKIVLDRCDGKPGQAAKDADPAGETLPQKVSRINRDRLNTIAEETTSDEDNECQTPTLQ